MRSLHITGQQEPKRPDKAKQPADVMSEAYQAVSAGNSAELEMLRQELRERSDGLRNTGVRETAAVELPGKSEEKQYTSRIDTAGETIYLGSDLEQNTIIASANPRGKEASHRSENHEYSSESCWCSVSTTSPQQRMEFTLSSSDPTGSDFIYSAAEDNSLERHGDGQIRRAAEEISSEDDEQMSEEVKNIQGLDTNEDSELSGLDDLAQSVKQRSQSLMKQTEQQAQKILNRISTQQSTGDDFFDFLRRRSDDDEAPTEDSGKPTETEGIIYEEDN